MSNYTEFLNRNYISGAAKADGGMVEYGYAQVEPNHLSAQRNGQIYAQLPAAADIDVLENGQFVKYDYAEGVVDFDGPGEWMLVFNEIKLYRDGQRDCEFALVKDNYQAKIYSPSDGTSNRNKQSRYYNGVGPDNTTKIIIKPAEYDEVADGFSREDGKDYYLKSGETYTLATESDFTEGEFTSGTKYYTKTKEELSYASPDKVTAPADPYEPFYNEDPFHVLSRMQAKRMPEGTTMVPRVFKTMPGDIFTTNAVKADFDDDITVGTFLEVDDDDGFFVVTEDEDGDFVWQVVKKYTMPDGQNGVKVMRIK